jgi:hypothetical protein
MKLGHGVVLNKIRSGRRSQNVTPVARSHSWGLDFQNWIRLALVSSVLGSSRSSDDKAEKTIFTASVGHSWRSQFYLSQATALLDLLTGLPYSLAA